jgi:hypothetical protein
MKTKDVKTHYRKVFKSDHLGTADLEDFIEEGKTLIFNISYVKQEINVSVAGRKGNHNIAYFKESIKPLVLNATNSKTVKGFAGGSPFVEDWNNIAVELYLDATVKMKGEIVGGVRIRPTQPKAEKKRPVFTEANFEKAWSAGATVDAIRKVYQLSEENETKFIDYVNSRD